MTTRDVLLAAGSSNLAPKALALAIDESPFIVAYSWNSGGFKGKFSNPSPYNGKGSTISFCVTALLVSITKSSSLILSP